MVSRRHQQSPRYDWRVIRLDYESGVLNNVSICHKHGVSASRLSSVAAKEGWSRRPPPTAEELYGSSVIEGRMVVNPADAGPIDDETLRKNAVLTADVVLDTHRRDIRRLRSNMSLIIERLGLILDGKELTLPCLGARESPADLLEKCSRVLVRVVQIERQAYNLEAMPQNPNGDDADAVVKSVMNEMSEIRAQIDAAANSKAREVSE